MVVVHCFLLTFIAAFPGPEACKLNQVPCQDINEEGKGFLLQKKLKRFLYHVRARHACINRALRSRDVNNAAL